jgi:hypothetical protein
MFKLLITKEPLKVSKNVFHKFDNNYKQHKFMKLSQMINNEPKNRGALE